ncbi:hypothetical protein HanLR1_Chr00c0030g0695341 [Helianthus annuus]|nr:hypothetical protein HanLR1_Chr00c0030g0695341 [Helianthus annuus]
MFMCVQASTNVLFDPVHNSCVDLDVQKCPLLSEFNSILNYMDRIPVKKAMTDQRPIHRSHIERFWKSAEYDEDNKVISAKVEVKGETKTILVTEELVREVMSFPDEADNPTRFPEKMVKGCMLRLGYRSTLNTGNYLKSKFQKSFKFLIHSILISLSHTKGSFDQMRDYQMNMLTALVLNKRYNFSHIVFHYMVENITSKTRVWRYPRFVQMMIDRAYPDIDRNIQNDLLVQAHMSNVSLKNLIQYHPHHPEPELVVNNFGLLLDADYADPDPVNHQEWRNEAEKKDPMYIVELKIIQGFKPTKNVWYVKESGRIRRLATPVAEGEGSSSQPKKKQKKKVQTLLVDESEDDIPAADAEKEQEVNIGDDFMLNTDVFETGPEVVADVDKEKGKLADDVEGDDVDKDTTSSSSSSEFEMIDPRESERRRKEELEKEKLLRKRKRAEKEDEAYVPSPEHEASSKITKKAGGRKKVTSTVRMSKRPQKILNTPPSKQTHSHQLTPPQSPIHQSPPRQSTPPQSSNQPSPSHLSPPKLPTPQHSSQPIHQSTPPQHTTPSALHSTPPQRPIQDIFDTPPLSQAQQSEFTSRGLISPQDNLLDIGSFDFANNSEVVKLEQKMEKLIAENQRLKAENKKAGDREKVLVKRVDELEKKCEIDQAEIDILKVRVSELEEEKSRRDAQNEYFELKHKELNEAKNAKDHELYMLHKVVESMLGSSVEEKYEEICVAEARAERQAEIDRQMKDKGKGLEGSSVVQTLDIVPVMEVENPQPISAISGLFEEPTSLHELIGASSDEEDEEENDGEGKDDFVFSASSHSSQNDDDDDATGGTGVRVSDASNEKAVDDLMDDTVNEEKDESDGKGESSQNQIVEHYEPLYLNLDAYRESLKDVHSETPFDVEKELESFDINKQSDYQYKYVEDADQYDRVEVEECSDSEEVADDTSKLPTLMEFFAAENREELRQKVSEAVKDNVFEELRKETIPENQSEVAKEGQSSSEKIDSSKWFKVSHERKFKRPLKYFQRDRSVSLGDIISWGFLPQVNAYAIRREYGVQYFQRLYDIMSLPWWDVDELSQVRTLEYPVRQNDKAIWGYIKYESLRGYLKWKPHRPRRVERVNPETGMRETILNVKPPRTLTTIPMPEMEQDFYKGFIEWVYSCLTTEAVITYRAGSELRYIRIYDPMWLVNCSAKDIECLFIHKIRYQAKDVDQAQQFQKVESL